MKKALFVIIAVALAATAIFLGEMVSARVSFDEQAAHENVIPESDETPDIPVQPEPVEIPQNKTIRILAAGDVMFHIPQIRSAARENGLYDFSPPFMYIKDYVESADIAIVNLETVIAREGETLRGFPRFNSPEETLDALKGSGFDVLITANNHSLDRGKAGIENTIDEIIERELDFIGTSKNDRRDVLFIEKEGIKVAILAYTFGLNGLDSLLTPEELDRMVNLIDEEKITASIDDAKEQGADITVVYLHWGNEYQRQASQAQKDLSRVLVESGADIVLGSHPHVVQEFETITTDTAEALVVYSMGNLISNQRYETMGVSYSEDGLMVIIEIEKDITSGTTAVKEVLPIPTWVDRYEAGSSYDYRILPVQDVLDGKLTLELTPEKQKRLEKSLNDTMENIYIYKSQRY